MSRKPTWWLIDGYNLLFRWAGPPKKPGQLALARHELLRAIEWWADSIGDRVTVVFDSRCDVTVSDRGDYRVEITFAPAGLGADAWIEQAVESCRNHTECKVVSSDVHVRHNVEAAGASSIGCGDFLQLLRRGGSQPRPPSKRPPTLGDFFPDLGELRTSRHDRTNRAS